MKLCTFVETLSCYMTNQNIIIRENGVIALSHVLSQLSQDYLTESELYFITIFYCDRLKDHYSIIPSVLSGILAIVSIYLKIISFYFLNHLFSIKFFLINFVLGKYDSFIFKCTVMFIKSNV